MSKFACFVGVVGGSLIIPSVAHAADAAGTSSGAAGIIAAVATGVAGCLTAGAAFLTARSANSRAAAADKLAATATVTATTAAASATAATASAAVAQQRAESALAWADRVANAHQDGVVLILSYPGTAASCRGLLEANGWQVAYYQVTQAELDRGALLPGPHVIADVCAADALVIEGLDEPGVARLAALREFRDNIRAGASVALYTGGRNYRYDLTQWGECDQAVNVPVTSEAAVRASLARREVIARRQGIRPGQLAAGGRVVSAR